MAAPNTDYNQVSAVTRKKFVPKLVDNVFDASPFLQRLKEKAYDRIDGGEKIVQPLEYAQATSSDWYTGAETLLTEDTDSFTAVEVDWKQIYASIMVTRRDELKNSGTERVIRFVKSKVKNAEKTITDKMATGVYSDGTTNTKSIVGTRAWIASSGTVGGISMTNNSWYQSQVDSSTTTLTISAVQTQFMNASLNNESPTVIFSTKANYNRYYALLQPQQRFQDSKTAKGGFSSLMFNGVPWIPDSYAPTNYIYGINEEYLRLIAHEQEDMRFEDFQKPINQNAKVAQIFWMGNLAGSNPRMHFVMSAVAA